jgi:hypothetical protein
MYFGSWNDILASLVCIINIVRFELQNSNSFLFIQTKQNICLNQNHHKKEGIKGKNNLLWKEML